MEKAKERESERGMDRDPPTKVEGREWKGNKMSSNQSRPQQATLDNTLPRRHDAVGISPSSLTRVS